MGKPTTGVDIDMVDASEVGRRSKRRGKTYERRVSDILTEFTKVGFRRVPNSGGWNKAGGVKIREELFCGDVICDRPDFRFCVEAKNRESFTFESILKNPATAPFTSWWYQCLQDAKSVGLAPMMFFKPDHQADCAVFDATDWLNFDFNTIPPHFMINAYHFPIPITLKITHRKGRTKEVEQVEIASLPTPVIVDWKAFTATCNPSQMFRG